jgi:hypothetical protein
MIRKSLKILVLVTAILILSGFTYAYAAANIVPATKAGDGSGVVSGFTVTSVAFNLDATNPTLISSVTFTLDSAATLVKIRLVSTGTVWYSCTGTTAIICATTSPQATVLATDTLQVVATGN